MNITNGIKVVAKSAYEPELSSIKESNYVWSYTIKIENLSENPVQLIARHWNIIDSDGCIKEVTGIGVVGEQPVIAPKEFYEYSSQSLIHTTSGIMVGNYEMLDCESGEIVMVTIPSFALEMPNNFITYN